MKERQGMDDSRADCIRPVRASEWFRSAKSGGAPSITQSGEYLNGWVAKQVHSPSSYMTLTKMICLDKGIKLRNDLGAHTYRLADELVKDRGLQYYPLHTFRMLTLRSGGEVFFVP